MVIIDQPQCVNTRKSGTPAVTIKTGSSVIATLLVTTLSTSAMAHGQSRARFSSQTRTATAASEGDFHDVWFQGPQIFRALRHSTIVALPEVPESAEFSTMA